jgi:acyl-CoA dehydrogenase
MTVRVPLEWLSAKPGMRRYAKEYHVERLVREALLFRIVPVTPQMLLSFIAEKALGLPMSY